MPYKVLIFSDSHGHINKMEEIIETTEQIDLIIHAGDTVNDIENIKNIYPQYKYMFVRGNCDISSKEEAENETILGGKRIYLTHGHLFSVKMGLNKLIDRAKEVRSDIAIFGHTHIPLVRHERGILLINPGHMPKSYAELTIDGDNINCDIIE